ncbi:(2Fe-2S)-binding protein [Kitasatospora sp. MMS16-BH015]|uniref:(2Fe-2S)-binding protein n=1 Tax=Kitasatospora sp. MMS16-BH015 TaxID=2018025 RepID=UPI000CA25355|nr:(2Fe-2S)-binding protein [Kitasatospora sp. MMS16-BH015]AUG78962.1 (2Fe-2S)-binding protein [Kitasatospora sp. MMS16-BH015]
MTTTPEIPAVATELTVNGEPHALHLEPRRSLADVLRRDLRLTGTQVGCETGACGSCTVLVDGEPVRSCLLLAVQADGCAVETVESLTVDGKLSPLQQAFSEQSALQCGFCTPGFLMLCTALLREEPAPSGPRVRECLSANLCRCTGYAPIVAAVESVNLSTEEQS